MVSRILVISLVPPEVLARMLAELRERHPEAKLTALVGVSWPDSRSAPAAADEVLRWGAGTGRSLLAEVRRRRFDAVVVGHGSDQYATRAYWKATALALASGCRCKRFLEDGAEGERGPAGAILGGAARAAVQLVDEAYAACMGVLLLLPLLIGAAVADFSETVSGGGRRGWERHGRRGARPRER